MFHALPLLDWVRALGGLRPIDVARLSKSNLTKSPCLPASLMDRRLINVEGIMQTGNLNGRAGYKLKMLIDIYGPLSSRDSVAPQLAWAGRLSSDGLPPYDAVTQVSGSRQTKKAGEKESEQERRAREIMEGLKDLDKGEQKHDALLDSLTKTVDVLKLPHHPDPPTVENGQLRNNLLVSWRKLDGGAKCPLDAC